jgi:hypothetical protein
VLQSNISKNPPERHRPQCPGAKKNIREALSNPYEPTFSVWNPTSHVT